MSRYSIEGSTLTAIGDAVRNKTGKLTRMEKQTIMVDAPAVLDIKSSNMTEYGVAPTSRIAKGTGQNGELLEFHMPGAYEIDIEQYFYLDSSAQVEHSVCFDTSQFDLGSVNQTRVKELSPRGSIRNVSSHMRRADGQPIDTFYLWWKNTDVNKADFFYWIRITGYDANGNLLPGGQVEKEIDVEVVNTLTPAQMAEEINNLGAPIPEEGLVITGSCSYRFAYNGWNWFIDACGDKITTQNITVIDSMFSNSTNLKSIPFDLNLSNKLSSGNLSSIFAYCNQLTEVPYIKGNLVAATSNYTNNPGMSNLFNNCHRLRYIPDDYFDQFGGDEFWSAAKKYEADRSNLFYYCYSLRKIPTSLRKVLTKATSYYYHAYYNLFYNCYALDEVINIPIEPSVALTSNCFSNTFNACSRLKNVLFETNEDGSPIAVNWKSQTITLTSVGKAGIDSYITNYNSGITVDKKVIDDATYQALKDDPDWYTLSWDYSRYNRTSAVATINSLPDTSAGGANIIKFKGAAGALTDGGAINTMTEEEIAVATAKGWTVSLS